MRQVAQRAPAGHVHLAEQLLAASRHQRPDPDLEPAGVVPDRERDATVEEVAPLRRGNGITKENRVRQAVDRELRPRGECADHAGQNGPDHDAGSDRHGELLRALGRSAVVAELGRGVAEANRRAAPLAGAAADLEAVGERRNLLEVEQLERAVVHGTHLERCALDGEDRGHARRTRRVGGLQP